MLQNIWWLMEINASAVAATALMYAISAKSLAVKLVLSSMRKMHLFGLFCVKVNGVFQLCSSMFLV